MWKEPEEFLAGKENGKIIFLSFSNVFDGSLEKPHLEDDLARAESMQVCVEDVLGLARP